MAKSDLPLSLGVSGSGGRSNHFHSGQLHGRWLPIFMERPKEARRKVPRWAGESFILPHARRCLLVPIAIQY